MNLMWHLGGSYIIGKGQYRTGQTTGELNLGMRNVLIEFITDDMVCVEK